jgi:hypothetical protein
MLDTPQIALLYFIWFCAAFVLAALLVKINS